MRDVVNEANAFNPAWGQSIFQSANEIAQNTALKKRMAELQAQKESEKEWWEARKKTIESEFMTELEGEKKAPSRTSDDDTVLVESGGPVDATSSQKKNKKKGKK